MRIGIDIDGVLTNIEQFVINHVSKYCVENKIAYHIGDSNYDYCKTFHISKEIENSFWKQYLEYYAIHEKARPFASEIVKKLKEDGHEIYIITSRWLANRDDEVGRRMREIVKNWLNDDKLIFSKASNESKYQEIMENEIDLMVEDNPNNIKELKNYIPVICYDAGYNKDCVDDDRMTRCYSWYDIYSKINNIMKG